MVRSLCPPEREAPSLSLKVEALICGIHLRRFEANSEEIDRLEKLMDYGFNLKEKEDHAYVPIISGCCRKRGCKQ